MITPRYKSEARILLDGRENIFLRPNADARDNGGSPDAEAVTSQVQLVLSRDLARRIIAKNRLGDLPEFDPVLSGTSPLRTVLSLVGIGRDPLRMTAEERVMEAYYDRLVALCGREVARHHHRIPVGRSRPCRARRQFHRRRLPRIAAIRTPGPGPLGGAMAVRRDRQSAQKGCRCRSPRRSVPFQYQSVRRAEQHHAVGAAAWRTQHAAQYRAHAEGGGRQQGAADPRHAAVGTADRGLRRAEFRAGAASQRAARHAAARSLPSSPPRCSAAIRASRSSRRRSPTSTARSATRRANLPARWKTTPASPAAGSIR